jgi:uncharacterized protein
MIRIDRAFAKGKNRLKTNKKDTSSHTDIHTSFESTLQDALDVETNQSVEALMQDLQEQEKKFLNTQSLLELNNYKNKVQKILKLILDGSFSTKTLHRKRRDKADYLIVEKINEKLLSLTRGITSPTNKAFNLMKELEEIRGLVCDLIF